VAVVSQGEPALVGGLQCSAVGASDLSGNAWEWQQDWWSNPPVSGVDAEGPASGSDRVVRGGGWYFGPPIARVAIRNYDAPGIRDDRLGVRLLRTAP
jgi:formylglycine-generating enzyme required for sulfatase activity